MSYVANLRGAGRAHVRAPRRDRERSSLLQGGLLVGYENVLAVHLDNAGTYAFHAREGLGGLEAAILFPIPHDLGGERRPDSRKLGGHSCGGGPVGVVGD